MHGVVVSEPVYMDPSEHRGWTAAMVLLQMDKRVAEFFNWIDERKYKVV